MPAPAARRPYSEGETSRLNPHSDRKAAAFEVVRAATTDEFLLETFDVVGWLPPKPGVYETAAARAVEPMGHYPDTLRVAGENAVPRPETAVWPEQSDRIAAAVNAAVAGNKTPERAASDLQTAIERAER